MGRLSVEDLKARFGASENLPCRVSGCDTFPFDNAADRDEHEATAHAPVPSPVPTAAPSFRKGPAAAATSEGVRPASDAAVRYLKSLVAKKRPDTDPAHTAAVIAQGAARVSKAIERLKEMPDVAPPAPRVRVNRYPGKCESCGKHVPAEAGRLSKADDDSWQVWHLDGECPAFELGVPDGRYAIGSDDDDTLRFYHLYDGQVFVMASDEEHLVPGPAARAIVAQIKLDPLAASVLYGLAMEQCGRCGRSLTVKASREAGIGPVCATKGWV